MATVLVVDDSALDRYLAGALLEEHAGMSVVYAEDGRQALAILASGRAFIPPLIGHLQDQMTQMKICDRGGLIRIGTALHEVLVNAIEHGNLELSSDLRETGDRREYLKLAEERRQQPPYR